VYSVSERRWPLILAIVLASPAVIAHVLPTLIGGNETLLFRMVVSAVFLTYITILLSGFLLRQERVSADMILGAMNVYLLVAIIFTFLHVITELARPGSYLYQGESLTAVLGGHSESHVIATLLYFSLVTLTTLGYGDISPAMSVAQRHGSEARLRYEGQRADEDQKGAEQNGEATEFPAFCRHFSYPVRRTALRLIDRRDAVDTLESPAQSARSQSVNPRRRV